MSTPADLYAAILADPDDMDLRLRYADAVEGTDPDHAALIRGQIERARLRKAGKPLPTDLYHRVGGLSRRLRDRLGSSISGLVDSWKLLGGFPELIRLRGSDFLARGEEIFRRAPVRHAILEDVDTEQVARLAASPLLARLTSLSLSRNPIGDDGVRALIRSPYLRRLRWLGLSRTGVTAEGAEALAATAAEVLPNLRYLDFVGNSLRIVPRGVGMDAISGDGPLDVVEPEFGVYLNERYGPFPWLDKAIGWRGFIDFSEV